MKSKRTKALDIPQKVKNEVWERDGGQCVICKTYKNVMPNAHYISRANGGLGIAKNIVTLCTMGGCHYKYDFGTAEQREIIRQKIKEYLQSKYSDWNEEDLVYKKY